MNIKSALTPITNVSQAKRFIDEVLALLGDGFHPDTPFDDYIHAETGKQLFKLPAASQLDQRMTEVCALFGDEELMYKVLLPENNVLKVLQIDHTSYDTKIINILRELASFTDTDETLGEFMVSPEQIKDRANEIYADDAEVFTALGTIYDMAINYDYIQITYA